MSYATFIIVIDDITKKVVDAAPIARWTIGKDGLEVYRYYRDKKKATIVKLED